MEDTMSQRPDNDDSTTLTPQDGAARTTRTSQDAPSRQTVAGTSGPTIGGEPAMPGTREFEQEVEHTAKTPMGITTGLLWTVGILLIVAVAIILFFAL
jgi:hypothetical protein